MDSRQNSDNQNTDTTVPNDSHGATTETIPNDAMTQPPQKQPPVLNKSLSSSLQQPQPNTTTTTNNNNTIISLPTDFFDIAEYMVMQSLKRDYYQRFQKSSYFMKLKHFLWYQDRRVLPDDFFVLRVLGRGGFGLVTGMYFML